jgi:hypothetical protein
MSKQPTRRHATRRAARIFAVGVAVAGLVGIVGAGQALAAVAVPDERVLERQGRIDRQTAPGQADEQGQVGDQQVAPGPVRTAPAGARGGLVVIVAVAALLLAVGATTTWRVRHRRPQPESTA